MSANIQARVQSAAIVASLALFAAPVFAQTKGAHVEGMNEPIRGESIGVLDLYLGTEFQKRIFRILHDHGGKDKVERAKIVAGRLDARLKSAGNDPRKLEQIANELEYGKKNGDYVLKLKGESDHILTVDPEMARDVSISPRRFLPELVARFRAGLGLKPVASTKAPRVMLMDQIKQNAIDDRDTATQFDHRGESNSAVNNYRSAIQTDPELASAYSGLAKLLRSMGKSDEAAGVEKALALVEQSAKIREKADDTYDDAEQLGKDGKPGAAAKYAEAAELYRNAWQKAPFCTGYYHYAIDAWEKAGRKDEVKKVVEEARKNLKPGTEVFPGFRLKSQHVETFKDHAPENLLSQMGIRTSQLSRQAKRGGASLPAFASGRP